MSEVPRVPSVGNPTVPVKPQTDVTIKFTGDIYKWIRELKEALRDAHTDEDVISIALDLLHQAIGKEIKVGSGPDAPVYNLWR